jgi:hypothetical protein
MSETKFEPSPPPVDVEGKVPALASKVGYGLLVISLAGYGEQFASPRFESALWKFQLSGALVENSPILLLALFLIFSEGLDSPLPFFERCLRPCLSCFCLILGISFFLLVPLESLLWFDLDATIGKKSAAEVLKADQLEEQLKKAKPEERDAYLQHGNPAPEAIRAAALGTLHRDRITIIVKCLKWSIEALAAGSVSICIWNASRWTRQKRRRNRYSESYR